MKEIVEHQHMVKPYLVYSMPQSIQSKMYGFFHFLYKRKQLTVTIIKRKWRLYQATEVVPSCVTRGTCIPNMLPGRPITGGSVLNGQAQDAEEILTCNKHIIAVYGDFTCFLPGEDYTGSLLACALYQISTFLLTTTVTKRNM